MGDLENQVEAAGHTDHMLCDSIYMKCPEPANPQK